MLKGLGTCIIRLFALQLICFVGVVGCEKKQEKPAIDVNELVDSPQLVELSEHWLDAARYLKLSTPVASAAASLRYEEFAECALVYDFEVTTTTKRGETGKPANFRNKPQTRQVLGRFELRPEVDAEDSSPVWRLHSRQVGQYTVRNEMILPGKESKEGELPDVVLRNEGNVLVAEEPDAVLWSRLHPFGGVAQFFPRFPESEIVPSSQPLKLRIVEHLLISDQPAVVMVATDEKTTARYVVLNSGRLLHAALSKREKVSGDGENQSGDILRTQVSEVRLTGACAEPTLPPIGQKTSRTRSALEAYTRLMFAVHGEESDGVLPYLSQDLIDAHGADKIVAMLKNHIERYGIGALGDPSMVDPVEVDGQLLRFRVMGRAEKSGADGESSVTIVNHVIIEDSESGMRVLSIASTSNQTSMDASMLELSPRRIFTASKMVVPLPADD